MCTSALVCVWGCVCACMCAFGCMRLTLQGVTLTRGVTEAGDPGPAPFLLPLTPTGPAAPQPPPPPRLGSLPPKSRPPQSPTVVSAWNFPRGVGTPWVRSGTRVGGTRTSVLSHLTTLPLCCRPVGFPNSVPQPLTLLTLQTQHKGPLLQEVFRARGPASSLPEEPSADGVLTAARAQGAAPRHRPAKAPEQPADYGASGRGAVVGPLGKLEAPCLSAGHLAHGDVGRERGSRGPDTSDVRLCRTTFFQIHLFCPLKLKIS